MAPLTRCRAGRERIPNQLMATYYAQRASAGLILSEATSISPMAVGYPATPGIWTREQVEGHRLITKAVHQAGGVIFLQLWHVGRISDPKYLGGETPVAPSAIAHPPTQTRKNPPVPRSLTIPEIRETVIDYKKAAIYAKEAGYDGVEVHGANGYLIEQFLYCDSNQRRDKYGGTIHNRTRFLMEVIEEILTVWPSHRVGLHLSPRDYSLSETKELYIHIAREMKRVDLSFLFIREENSLTEFTPLLKKEFQGHIIANQELDLKKCGDLLNIKAADLFSFGRDFISNPDLPIKLQHNSPLTPYDLETFYSEGARGYTDYV